MAEKITVAQKFAATIAILAGETPEIEFDRAQAIAFLEDRAEKAKSKPRAKKVDPEKEELRKAIASFLAEQAEPVTAKVVAEGMDISTQKASAALRALVEEDVAIAIAPAKARDAKTYVIA